MSGPVADFAKMATEGYADAAAAAAAAGKKDKQAAVPDPSAGGTSITFIDSISQNADGEIAPTKKTVAEAVASSSGVGGSAGLMTGAEKEKLAGVAAGAEVNVQSDWNQTDSSADDYIKNKPTVPSASTAAPQMDGAASAGSSGAWAKGDHVHPRDTSKLDGEAVYPIWNEVVPYGSVGTVVSWNGRLWRNNAQTMGDEPGVSAYWDEVFLKDVKADAYDFSSVQTISGAGTEQSPNEVTPVDAQNKRVSVEAVNAYIAVALPAASANGRIRDFMLTLDCSSLTEGQEPTVTWGTHFHPRTDAGTDFACAAGVRNVYYISEYATDEFVVGGWQETAGGSGT